MAVGKTSTPEFGTLNFTKTKVHGITRNPWDTARTPGGSSGGTAAAVAAGIIPFGTASDGGGSIRIPAAFSGLLGHKCSHGRIPLPGPTGNNTSVRGQQLGYILRDAAAARAAQLPGVIVADGPDKDAALAVAAKRQLPVLTMDGSLTGMTQARTGTTVSFRAQVMFTLRKESMLRGSLSGAATASGITKRPIGGSTSISCPA